MAQINRNAMPNGTAVCQSKSSLKRKAKDNLTPSPPELSLLQKDNRFCTVQMHTVSVAQHAPVCLLPEPCILQVFYMPLTHLVHDKINLGALNDIFIRYSTQLSWIMGHEYSSYSLLYFNVTHNNRYNFSQLHFIFTHLLDEQFLLCSEQKEKWKQPDIYDCKIKQ